MKEITCRGCGKPESECTCNVPTIDTQIIKLQARIKELETLVPTKEEAKHILKTQRDLCELGKTENDDGSCYICRFIEAKLKAIIDKRGCNED